MGLIYALMAMGFILIVRAVGFVNFAQGELLMVGAYVTFMTISQFKLPFFAAIILAVIILAAFAVLFMFSTYWPLRKATWDITFVISTLGASMVLKELVRFIWGSVPLRAEPLVEGILKVGDVVLDYQFLYIIAISLILIGLVFFLFEGTFLGRALQAAAQDQYAASLIGIPVILTIALTFIISTLLAGVGGFLFSPIFFVSTSIGSSGLKAFAGLIIGGYGSVKGALIGALFVGIIEAFSAVYLSTTYKDAIVFLILIIVLAIRPQGLFGEKIAEKA